MDKLMDKLNIKVNEKSLDDTFNKALQDDYFKKVISNLNLPKNELKKYTSSILDVVEEIKNCENCKSLSSCKNALNGYCYRVFNEDDKVKFTYQACKYKNNELKKTKYEKNVKLYKEPYILKKAKMKDIYFSEERVEVIKYIDEYYKNYFKNRKKGLYLYGNFGCGKTYLIASLFNELAKVDVKSVIIYFPDFLRELKSSFNTKEEGERFEDKYSFVKESSLLLIDDIGAENITVWARDEVLGPILQYRMQQELPTFFTSNLSLEELERHLSTTNTKEEKVNARRIMERIEFLSNEMKLIDKNYRKLEK